MASPALQRGEMGLHKFITESRRDGARTLFMQEPIKPRCFFEFMYGLKPVPFKAVS